MHCWSNWNGMLLTNKCLCSPGWPSQHWLHPKFPFISPSHRNTSEFSCLFHTISSSSVFNKAAIAVMKAFNWRRIGLVHDSLGFYFRNTANNFYDRVQQSYSAAEIITWISIDNLHAKFFKIINDREVRINYWVVNDDQGAFTLCEAYKRRLFWPGYVYILMLIIYCMPAQRQHEIKRRFWKHWKEFLPLFMPLFGYPLSLSWRQPLSGFVQSLRKTMQVVIMD